MKTQLRNVVRAVTFIALIWIAPTASACQCTEYGTPECARFWRAKFVFIAKVKSISRKSLRVDMLPPDAKASTMSSHHATARLQVQQVLRGEMVEDEVFDSVGNGADCLLEYRKGQRYLIFASDYDPATKIISTSVCSGSNELEPNGEDALNSIVVFRRQTGESLVLGQVLDYWSDTTIKGIEVRLQSDGLSYSTRTDAEGKYRFALKQGAPFKVNIVLPFPALEEGYAGVDYISEEPEKTVLGYEDTLQTGQCHYKELHVARTEKK